MINSLLKFKHVALILTSIAAVNASAITVRVVGKNNAVLFESNYDIKTPVTAGIATVGALNAGNIPFKGADYGILKMFDLTDDIDVISDTEMKSYGWCFSIDGVVPNTTPDHVSVKKPDSVIEWFYAYAWYNNGDWVGQCYRHTPLPK
jgi:hypothetical protein